MYSILNKFIHFRHKREHHYHFKETYQYKHELCFNGLTIDTHTHTHTHTHIHTHTHCYSSHECSSQMNYFPLEKVQLVIQQTSCMYSDTQYKYTLLILRPCMSRHTCIITDLHSHFKAITYNQRYIVTDSTRSCSCIYF